MKLETVIMSARLLAEDIKSRTALAVGRIRQERNTTPKLVALLIGDDPVSRTYVNLKRKDCMEVGITSEVIDMSSFGQNESAKQILEKIRELNDDPSVNAIIPQMPFSGKVSEEAVFSTLDTDKDVDGLTPYRLGKLIRGDYDLENGLLPCTPKGIVLLSKYYNVQIESADIAIVGRSTLVGEPLRKLFQDFNGTSTCYHTKTKNLDDKLKEADIVVAASGRPPEIYGKSGFRVLHDTVKDGSTVISVGVRKDEKTGRMLYDVDTEGLKGKCSFLTPNTGAVGVMTRVCLLQNTLNATKIQLSS